MPLDDLGIEIDEDVTRALADPKAGVLTKVVDYLVKRREKQAEIEADKKKKESESTGIFGGILS